MTDSRSLTLKQLLHLVDRARRGVALAAELDDLQAGITALEAARRSNGGMQQRMHTMRQQLAAVEALVADAESRLLPSVSTSRLRAELPKTQSRKRSAA